MRSHARLQICRRGQGRLYFGGQLQNLRIRRLAYSVVTLHTVSISGLRVEVNVFIALKPNTSVHSYFAVKIGGGAVISVDGAMSYSLINGVAPGDSRFVVADLYLGWLSWSWYKWGGNGKGIRVF